MNFLKLFFVILGVSIITLFGTLFTFSGKNTPVISLPARGITRGDATPPPPAISDEAMTKNNVSVATSSDAAPVKAIVEPGVVKQTSEKVSTPGALMIKASPKSSPPVSTSSLSIQTDGALNPGDIMRIVNLERAKEGLAPLAFNPKLSAMADAKAKDMIARHYFAHVAPDGTDVVALAKRYGYDYLNVGENLAMGDFTSSVEVMDGWMNSPGHRANILNKEYTEVGISALEGEYEGRLVWYAVQEFGRPESACAAPDTVLDATIQENKSDIASLGAQLTELRTDLDNSRDDADTYNKLVDEYNAILGRYNQLASETKDDIDRYNVQVDAFNACAAS